MRQSSTESLPFVIILISSMLFKRGLFIKRKNIKSKSIGLFYLAISWKFSSGTYTTYLVFPSFFLTMHFSANLTFSINSDKEHTERSLLLDKAKLDKGNTNYLIMLTLKTLLGEAI